MEENKEKKVRKGPTYFELKKQVKDLQLDVAKVESTVSDRDKQITALNKECDRLECLNNKLSLEKKAMAEQNEILANELERMRRRKLWERIRNK